MPATTRQPWAIGGGVTLASAALCGGVAVWLTPVPQTAWAVVVGGAVVIGMGVWFAVHRVTSRHRRDVSKLTDFVRMIANSDQTNTTPPRLSNGLDETAQAVSQTTCQLSAKLQELTAHKRDIELRSRVSESERRNLEAILNAISDGVIVTDAFNEVSIANASAARVLSFDLDPALHRPVEDVVRDPRMVKLIKDTRDAGPAMRRSIEQKIGATEAFQITTTCVGGDPGESQAGGGAGVVTVLRDITKDKEIAAMKSDFVSKVSHELRTPLSSIKAYVEMLIDGEAHDEQTRAEFYDIVQSETERLQRLIDNILSISRIESGVTKVHRENIALPVLVKECVGVLEPQAEAKQITLTAKPFPMSFEIFADRDMIYQATMNLISNAVKYTPEGGEITVQMEVDEHDQTVTVAVTDNGVGIPAQDLPNLFGKFFRVQANNKIAKGTGLGLNMVKHVIETVHGGHVKVQSVVGEGSTFSYTLSIAENK